MIRSRMPAGGLRLLSLPLVLALAAGCASRVGSDGPPPQSTVTPPMEPIPREEPRSRYGNGPFYEVL
ncbi:MAG TPA: septal ring lytic transglycosylase RlpA family protein, partial [Woeseiaceae bacterium]|nr:septal ring lytic transglycosylase RlpA family protein [Woeseiaceae bacterium]